MSANLLRRAAAKLRDALAADYLTEGPWDCLDDGDRIVRFWDNTVGMEYVVDEPMSNPSNAEYIALMHPPVALALAAWLDSAARDAEEIGPDPFAVATAWAVLREPGVVGEAGSEATPKDLELVGPGSTSPEPGPGYVITAVQDGPPRPPYGSPERAAYDAEHGSAPWLSGHSTEDGAPA